MPKEGSKNSSSNSNTQKNILKESACFILHSHTEHDDVLSFIICCFFTLCFPHTAMTNNTFYFKWLLRAACIHSMIVGKLTLTLSTPAAQVVAALCCGDALFKPGVCTCHIQRANIIK